MEDGNPIVGIIIILILIILNSIVTSTKVAFANVNKRSVKKKADNGDRKALMLYGILERPIGYLNTLELLLSFIGVVIGMAFTTQFLQPIEAYILQSGMLVNVNVFTAFYYILFTIILIFVTVLFGTIIPKKFALKHTETMCYRAIGLVKFFSFLFKPLAYLLDKMMNIILRVFGVKPSEWAESVTEEEIVSMVNEGHEQGVFDAGEAEMIMNIIELDGKEAQDIMTHKKKIIAVNSEMTTEEALRFMLSENHSRYPLYEDNRDNIIGILHLKDVFNAYISEDLKNRQLIDIVREPYFVPDTQNVNMLFHDMQLKSIHMAIVIDEYGQTAGLVAMEDFLEEIVGNIQDEYDQDEKMIIAIEKDSVVVKGSISLEELEDELNISIDHEDFETLNGLLISLLDRIPSDGEKATLVYQKYQFNILETMNKMIEQVRISRLPENQEEQSNIIAS